MHGGRALSPAEQREAAKITPTDIMIAFRTLRHVQNMLGVDPFPMGWRLPAGCKDSDPLAVRRTWFYALLREDGTEPLFSIRKLARIANLSEKVVRNDLRCMEAVMENGDDYVRGYLESVCETVDDVVPCVTGAAEYLRRMAGEIEIARKEAREALAAARKAKTPLPLLDSRRTSEVGAIIDELARRRAEVSRRIDMAVVRGNEASAREKRAAQKRLTAGL